jgi:ABC-type uncharacterized transport system permease subunit
MTPAWSVPGAQVSGRRLVLSALVALVAGFLLIAAVSRQPVDAFVAMVTGAVPLLRHGADGWHLHRMARAGAVLEDATTLMLLGLAAAIPFRARQYTLGADGALFLSALAAVTVSLTVPGPAVTTGALAALAALATGAAWSAIPGAVKAVSGASEIVISLMLNVIAIEFYRLAVSDWLRDPRAGFIATPPLPQALTLAPLLPHTHVNAMLPLAVAAAGAAAWFLARTEIGYEIRVLGDSPAFARRMGIPVARTAALSMAAGGLFSAAAGLHLAHGLLARLPVDLNPGLGLDGFVVAFLAGNRPRYVPAAALLYACLRTGSLAMERATDVPHEVVLVIQAVLLLCVLSRACFAALGSAR